MAQIGVATCPGMVAVGMGDNGFVHGPPGVDEEPALRAVETTVCEFDEWHIVE